MTQKLDNPIQPKINLEFYSGEDLYSDGDVEDEILEIVSSGADISQVLASDKRWPVLYHLSPIRRNILEWYNPDKESRLLEIGAGCGALTGLFCEKVKEVVAVELSKRRAEIIAARNRDNSNLEIIVGNLNEISFNEKFDYITLIGVLEYSGKYTETDNPYRDFLIRVKELLKPEGTLIIAIENKFGLKYWAGAKEDHNGRYFESIENFLNDISVRTFGKSELEELLSQSGFKDTAFYYPMPDYKLPNQVFSDDYLPDIGQILDITPNYDGERIVLFNESAVYDNIILNKQFDFFANSFLVFCNNTGKRPQTVYSKFNRERLPAFQIETSIFMEEGELRTVKKPLTIEACEHIACLYNNHEILKNNYNKIKVINAQYMDDNIIFDFIDGKSLDRILVDAVINRNINEFYKLLDRFVDCVKNTAIIQENKSGRNECSPRIFDDFSNIDTDNCVDLINMDINLDNLYLDENKNFVLIDYEWIFNVRAPVNVMIFRSMEYFWGKYNSYLKDFINLEDLINHYNISDVEIQIYRSMEKNYRFM
ncbi:class I SAM-dependent methyltransferase [Thermodesulfobacteriota bacterium]